MNSETAHAGREGSVSLLSVRVQGFLAIGRLIVGPEYSLSRSKVSRKLFCKMIESLARAFGNGLLAVRMFLDAGNKTGTARVPCCESGVWVRFVWRRALMT